MDTTREMAEAIKDHVSHIDGVSQYDWETIVRYCDAILANEKQKEEK